MREIKLSKQCPGDTIGGLPWCCIASLICCKVTPNSQIFNIQNQNSPRDGPEHGLEGKDELVIQVIQKFASYKKFLVRMSQRATCIKHHLSFITWKSIFGPTTDNSLMTGQFNLLNNIGLALVSNAT